MGGFLLPLAIGTQAVGTIAAANAARVQAENEQAIAEYNAKVEENEAKYQEQIAAFKSRRQAKEAARIRSQMLASLGTTGAEIGVGAPLLALAAQDTESELDNLLIGYEGQIGASRARSRATGHRLTASAAGSRASSAMTAGYIKAGTGLLTGFDRMRRYDYDRLEV